MKELQKIFSLLSRTPLSYCGFQFIVETHLLAFQGNSQGLPSKNTILEVYKGVFLLRGNFLKSMLSM